MKVKVIISFILFAFSMPAMAQKVVYACQYVASGGLVWENGNWVVKRFNLDQPFFLTAERGQLEKSSVAKFFDTSPENVSCDYSGYIWQSCSGLLGEVIFVNLATLNGTLARVFGGTYPTMDENKDSINVSPFTCTKVE